jgi:DNA ligase (NAD+)
LLANPRNAASGTLKMQDSSIVAKRRLNCYLYQLLGENLGVNKHHEAIAKLEQWGFNVSQTYENCTDMASVFAFIDDWREKRLTLPVETDGVVIKVNDYEQQEELGFTAKIPRWAIAFKYKAESAESELLSITYQVGRTGAITPVANLAPVNLAGTTVKRASLHNANEIERLELHEGDRVFVEKGGEIIPKITGVIKEARKKGVRPIAYITHCPECGTTLERKEGEAKHFCLNSDSCPPQVLGRIEHFVSKRAMDIDSMGTERLRALINQGYIIDPADIYELPGKKDSLIGLEVSDDQYAKSSEGYLFVSLKKALYALTEGLSLGQIEDFLENNSDSNQEEKLVAFLEWIPLLGKKVKGNLRRVRAFAKALSESKYDKMEDFVPISLVLPQLGDLPPELERNLERLTLEKNTVHDIVAPFLDKLPQELQESVKKLKGNTFQAGVVGNMVEGIMQSKHQPFERVLFALGIRNVGENTAILLVDHFPDIDKLKNAETEELLAINGVGETLVNSIRDFFSSEKNIDVINRLKTHGIQFESKREETIFVSQKLEGKKILASGKLNHFKRDEIIDFIQSHGGTYVKSVSKNLDFIIEGEDMGPSKKEKAQKLGVSLITEDDFLKLVNQ